MTFEEISSLLAVQEAESRVLTAEAELKQVPAERHKVQAQIAAEEAALEAEKKTLQELEVRRQALETEVGQAEAQVVKYKTQQLEVKKNDEYQALTHEIEQMGDKISRLESEELEIMMSIDETRAANETAAKQHQTEIAALRKELTFLDEREQAARASLDEARTAVETARATVEKPLIRHYDNARRSAKAPWIVPLDGALCQGCRLKVSNETLSAVRRASELPRCDNCGRIVYLTNRDL